MKDQSIESQIRYANEAVKQAKKIQKESKRLLQNQKISKNSEMPETLDSLAILLKNISKNSDKAILGAKMAQSRAKNRLLAVQKASIQTISHTNKAKQAALLSQKFVQKAIITSKKIHKNPDMTEKYRKNYVRLVRTAMKAAKKSEKEMVLAIKSSKTARFAARMPLMPKKVK